MKKHINNNKGIALPAVIIMMMILTVLAAGLGTYALNALERVMYMDTQKQAYYLARAGIETGAYAYQSATTKSDKSSDVVNANSFNNVDSFVSILENSDEIVKSDNYIWLIPSSNPDENSDTEWEGLTFTATDSLDNPPPAAIGYFSIELVRSYQDIIVDQETGETAPSACVEIRSTAVCFNDKNSPATSETKKQIMSGYVFPTKTVDTGIYCDDDGYLLDDGFTNFAGNIGWDDLGSEYTGKFDYCSGKQTIDYQNFTTPNYDTTSGGFISRFVAFFKNLYNGLVKELFKLVVPDPDYFYVYGVYENGDMIIGKPSATVDTLKVLADHMGFYVFSSSGTLTVDAGVDVKTTDGKYATVAFYGNDIVINGDITMEVYYTRTAEISSSILAGATDTINKIIATLGNRYRLGTVVIGAGTASGGKWYEYESFKDGGITDQDGEEGITNANRVFFNGNVSVKIYSQGSRTEVYRLFNSGDVCLFNGNYIISEGENKDKNGNPLPDETADDVRGIDLLKYFLDAVAIGEINYGTTTADKMKEVIELYYGETESYFDKDGDGKVDSRPIRKLNVNYGTDRVTIDDYSITHIFSNGSALANYVIQPSPTSVLNIYWGKPSDSGFDKAANK